MSPRREAGRLTKAGGYAILFPRKEMGGGKMRKTTC